MRTPSSQRYTENWVISIVLTMFLFLTSAAGFIVLRAVIIFGDHSSLATPSAAAHKLPSRIQP
jgi:hypothetical protein